MAEDVAEDLRKMEFRVRSPSDPITGTWRLLMPMSWERVSHSASVITGQLYIVGGHDVQRRLNSVECLDPGSGSWQTLPPMSTQRVDHTASVIAGQLYVKRCVNMT